MLQAINVHNRLINTFNLKPYASPVSDAQYLSVSMYFDITFRPHPYHVRSFQCYATANNGLSVVDTPKM